MSFTSALDILRFAIEREDDAAKGYGDLALYADAAPIRGLLLDLQSEERNHKRLLENIVDGRAEVLAAADVPDLKLSDYTLEEPFAVSGGFQDLLLFAARKEEKAAELYGRLRDGASDPELRRLLAFLIQQEKAHKLKIEQEYEARVLPEN